MNKELIRINQDAECRPPFLVAKNFVTVPSEGNDLDPLRVIDDQIYIFIKHLFNQEFIIAYYNFFEEERDVTCIFADAGVPYSSGYGFDMKDIFSGEELGVKRDYHRVTVAGHDCKLYRCKLVNLNGKNL